MSPRSARLYPLLVFLTIFTTAALHFSLTAPHLPLALTLVSAYLSLLTLTLLALTSLSDPGIIPRSPSQDVASKKFHCKFYCNFVELLRGQNEASTRLCA